MTIPISYGMVVTPPADAELSVTKDYTQTTWSSAKDFKTEIDVPN